MRILANFYSSKTIPQISLSENKPLLSTSSLLSQQPIMTHQNIKIFLDKVTCTDCVDFNIDHDRFAQLPLCKNEAKSLDVKIKVSGKTSTKTFDS